MVERIDIDDAEPPSWGLDHGADVDAALAANQEIGGVLRKAIFAQKRWPDRRELDAGLGIRRCQRLMGSAEGALTGADAPGTGVACRVIAKTDGPAMARTFVDDTDH